MCGVGCVCGVCGGGRRGKEEEEGRGSKKDEANKTLVSVEILTLIVLQDC